MNSVWLTSPFVKFNTDNLIYNETLCSEAHFLNKFARDKYKAEDQNSSMSNERQGNFTIASNYSSKTNLHLQGGAQDEDVEENCTITVNGNFHIKIDSKVSLKKSESKRTLSETNLIHSENVTCSTNVIDEPANKIREVDVKTELSGSNRTKSFNYVSNKKKSQLAANDTTEDQIEDTLLSCPFELVQIYPGNKENICDLDRNLSDISRQGSSIISFPKEDNKSLKSRVLENDDPRLSKIKGDRACEQHPASNSQSHNESKAVEDAKEKSETFKLSTVRDISSSASSDDNEKSCSTGKEKKRSPKERSRHVLKRSEELMNYLDHATTKMGCNFVDHSDTARSRKACRKFDETMPLVCESEKVLKEDLIGAEEVVSSLLKVDAFNIDLVGKYPNKSNENNVTKSRCDLSSVANSSDNDFLKINDTVIEAKKRKFGSESKSIDLKESLQIVTEKREKGKNISDTIDMVRVNDKQNGGNRNSERKMTEYAIDDASNGMIEKNAKFSVDYRNIKICNLLSKIREQLYINFQKMESIWIQLQDTSPIDSVRSTMPLRLLVRIISRCKSYIHDSHDSCKAELMIAENLFNLVIELAKSVDQNKLVLENQERQIDTLLLKLYQEKSLYKKRIMMNEVVSFWDHGLREISDIMKDISDKLRTIVTESEEKENVRNSRRKDGAVESKGPKVNLMKKESRIETQMSVALNKHNTINRPKSKTSMNLINTQRPQEVWKLSNNEPLKIVERKMNDNISLNRYNSTKHPKSKTSSKSLNIQRHQEVWKLSNNEPLRIVERKMNDNISLNRYNATKHPKSKTSTKSLNIQGCQEVEKLSFNEPFKIVERKINDIVRYSEKVKPLKKSTQSVNFEQSRLPLSRQKYRATNNPQPAWRPGGAVKLPSSSSATTLTQKNRTLFAQANERANQLTDNMKEGKHGRSGESKKYRTPSLTIDSFKYSSRKYTMNPETTSKLKPKSRALKVCFKEDNGSSGRSESPSSEKTLSERVNRQKTSKEAKVLKLLEEIIKSTAADKEDKRTTNKSVGVNYPNQTNSMDLERSTKPISIEEEMEIPQDEPTRDIDPNQVVQSRSKDTEVFDKTEQLVEKMPERPPIMTSPTDLASSSVIKGHTMDSKSNADLENSQLKNNCNFACTTDAKRTTDSNHSSSCTAEVESSNSQQTSASCASQKPQKNELKTSSDSMTVKEERYKNSSSVNVCTNSHTMSLTILKEFLRDQGVDVDLLNRAEQCVRDKWKCRGCLKTKSLSLADVMTFTKQRIEPSENATESSCCQGDMLKEIVQSCERNSADLKVAMKSFDQNCKDILKLSVPEKKDTATCTETENKDSSVQTSLRETQTKGVQIIIEEDTPLATKRGKETIETQTEMISTNHTATSCCTEMMEGAGKLAGKSNSVNSLSMAESTSVKDSTTETVQVFCVSKLTGTEWPRSNVTKEISDNYDQNARNFIEIWNEMYSKGMCLCDDRDLTVKHRHLNRLNEDSSDKALVCLQNGHGCEWGFRESDSSSSSCCSQFPDCSNCCAMLDPELNNFNKVISSETIATLQSAAIRARNMYRAIYFYQQHMENKLKEEEEKKELEKVEKCEKSKDLSTVDSIDIIVNDSYHSCKYDVEILSRAEIASLSDESEYEISKSVSMLSTTVSYNGRNVSCEDGLEIGQKSSSTAVLEVVKSLMEVLIQKIDDVKVTQIDCVQTVSSRTCSKIRIELLKVENEKNEFSMSPFSRQNLLMLVYGVVCSIVFWSLQFTISCDVVA